jgi:hypothetical protein
MSKKLSADQKLFNKVYRHAFKQNAQSRSDIGCAYRGANNTRCFIGCAIPNKVYTERMEGEAADTGKYGEVGLVRTFLESQGYNIKLAAELQNVHDGFNVEYWKDELERVARKYSLTTPKL